jgi:flavodoxin I
MNLILKKGAIMATAIFYASDTGHTEDVAKIIAKRLGDIEVFDITSTSIKKIQEYDKLIFGISTWGEGDLQADWEDLIDEFDKIDLNGKTVALFGLGDQDSYGDTFVNAMGTLYKKILAMGAKVIGEFNIDSDYDYESSTAVINGKFVGLALDEDNQEELSDKRITLWVNQIKDQIL